MKLSVGAAVLRAVAAFVLVTGLGVAGLFASGIVGREVVATLAPGASPRPDRLHAELSGLGKLQEWQVRTHDGVVTIRVSVPGRRFALASVAEANGYSVRDGTVAFDLPILSEGGEGTAALVIVGHLAGGAALLAVRQFLCSRQLSLRQSLHGVAIGILLSLIGMTAEWFQRLWLGIAEPEVALGKESLVLSLAAAVVVAPIVEEAAFRGLLQFRLRERAIRPVPAAVAVSVLFAGVHGAMALLLPTFLMSLVLCWQFERHRSWKACAVAHATANAIALWVAWG